MKISSAEYKTRRQKFLAQLPKNAIAILPTAPERHKTADSYYDYHPDNSFYYLTGYDEPNCVAVFMPGRTEGEFLLFNMLKIREQEIWTGFRVGQEAAVSEYGANQAFPMTEFDQMLPELLTGRESLYFALGRNPEYDQKIILALNELRGRVRSGVAVPDTIINVEKIIFEMRLIKTEAEIDLLRTAGQISVGAHKKIMKICKPGMNEFHIAAEIMYELLNGGCQSTAYGSIVAGGENGIVLHYQANNAELKSGDLLLVDAGGEYQFYDADITTTFPVNGKFSTEQKLIYDLVLKAQHAAFSKIKPGIAWWTLQETILQVFAEGLLALGILQGSVEKILEDKSYFKFYMHNSGHWLGLDTHDVGAYKVNGEWRKLAKGMVFTVEPGLYLSKDIPGLDPKWHDIAVRIEDDVVVTESGYDILTKGLPRTTDEIEAFMKG